MSEYGEFQTGEEHGELDQLHQAEGSEQDYQSQFGVFEQDHAAAEDTHFAQGHQVEYDSPTGEHYEESDYTNYDHSAAETDHVFAAEGSESASSSQFSELDALQERFDAAFAEGTVVSN